MQQHPLLFASVAALFGLFVGSFLNVVIYRMPVMMQRSWRSQCQELLELKQDKSEPFNLSRPRSRCPHCGHLIGALENIPVLSYLLQRGRCRH
ncbi:prepilin peptidase, partial [Marinobacter sp.]|uniref:prepilin peptidase n=1 Tax=Marinobacter sp. TaxID=50741 RepID=UPI0019F14BC6